MGEGGKSMGLLGIVRPGGGAATWLPGSQSSPMVGLLLGGTPGVSSGAAPQLQAGGGVQEAIPLPLDD